MTAFHDRQILVTGASGQFGRLVTAELVARGGTNVTAGSRDPSKLSTGTRTARVDFDDPASLDAAFAGIDRLLIVSTDAMQPGVRRGQQMAAVDAARRAGVGHIFYTSIPAPAADHPLFFVADHFDTEAAIRASGIPYTFLRNNWYFENTLHTMPPAIASGTLYTSSGDGRIGHAARADQAAAAAGAILTEEASGAYDLTGSEAMPMSALVSLFNEVLGTDIRIVQLDDEALRQGLVKAGVPEGFVGAVVGIDRTIREGRLAQVTGDLERLAGRKPQRFADWLRANAGLFRPATAAA